MPVKCTKCSDNADAYWEHRGTGRREPLCAKDYMRRAYWILGIKPGPRKVS